MDFEPRIRELIRAQKNYTKIAKLKPSLTEDETDLFMQRTALASILMIIWEAFVMDFENEYPDPEDNLYPDWLEKDEDEDEEDKVDPLG